MKAYKIDVIARTVTEVEQNSLEDVYRHTDCSCITVALYLENGTDCIYVDDEGLLKVIRGAFLYKGAPQPYVGNGLVVGTDKEGDTTDPKISIEEVRKNITFMDSIELRLWAARNSGEF